MSIKRKLTKKCTKNITDLKTHDNFRIERNNLINVRYIISSEIY